MPNSIRLVLSVEVALIVLTTLCLIQPPWLFSASSRAGSVLKWGSFFLLCVLFCWSLLTGVVLSVNGLTIRM